MAPPKRKSGGRVTAPGTRPGDAQRSGATSGHAPGASHIESGRYTAPIPKSERESPRWVPMLMLGLLIGGGLLIMLRYLVWSDNNLPLMLGMACLLGGLYTGTKWR